MGLPKVQPRVVAAPRLAQAVEGPAFDSRSLIGERLEAVAQASPSQVIYILERLLAGRDEPMSRYDLVGHAPAIIAAALDSGVPQAVEAADRVMNFLGRGGHRRIKELVDQQRNRWFGRAAHNWLVTNDASM